MSTQQECDNIVFQATRFRILKIALHSFGVAIIIGVISVSLMSLRWKIGCQWVGEYAHSFVTPSPSGRYLWELSCEGGRFMLEHSPHSLRDPNLRPAISLRPTSRHYADGGAFLYAPVEWGWFGISSKEWIAYLFGAKCTQLQVPAPWVCAFCVGVYGLFVIPARIIRGIRRRCSLADSRICADCGYCLLGNQSGRCSECGNSIIKGGER